MIIDFIELRMKLLKEGIEIACPLLCAHTCRSMDDEPVFFHSMAIGRAHTDETA